MINIDPKDIQSIITAVGGAITGVLGLYGATRYSRYRDSLRTPEEQEDLMTNGLFCREHGNMQSKIAEMSAKLDAIPELRDNQRDFRAEFRLFAARVEKMLDDVFATVRRHEGELGELRGRTIQPR